MRKILTVFIVIYFLVGCKGMVTADKKKNISPPPITTKHCDLCYFKSIVIGGNTQVKLVKGNHGMDIKGIYADQYDCQNSVVDQVLYLKDVATAKVSVSGLKNITVTDNATVYAKNFKTGTLTINAKDFGSVNLNGHFNIKKISQLGSGRINIGWIDSNKLRIESYNSGPICLAGAVNSMVVKLINSAMLNARYLRAKNIAAFTTDNARAEVTAVDTLKAFAINKSNIYYYKRPKNITVVTKDSGNVLQLDWIR